MCYLNKQITTTVYSETGLETKIYNDRGARTGGTYYVPNTHQWRRSVLNLGGPGLQASLSSFKFNPPYPSSSTLSVPSVHCRGGGQPAAKHFDIIYTWDAVTSVNLKISMVRWLRRHIVCIRSIVYMNKNDSFSALIVWKKLIDICFFFDSRVFWHWQLPIQNFEEWFGRGYEAVATGHVPRCVVLPHRHAGRLHWGKAESIQLCYFWMGQVITGAEAQFCLSFQRCVHRRSCWSQAKPARQ